MSTQGNSKTTDLAARQKNKPIYSRKYWTGRGNVEVAVFGKAVNEGKVSLFVTAKKTYKDDKGDYQETTAYEPHELLVLARAVQDAYDFATEEQNRE